MMESGPRRASSLLRPPRDAVRLEVERGDIVMWNLAPHIFLTEMRGHMTPAMSTAIIERTGPLYEKCEKIYGFHNWLEMTGYESICRVELTSWAVRNKAKSALHIASASRMVAMGVMVAKVALGDALHVYQDLAALERELVALLGKRR
jgi:hypothetical protein